VFMRNVVVYYSGAEKIKREIMDICVPFL